MKHPRAASQESPETRRPRWTAFTVRRFLTLAILSLLLGALATVSVSWYVALRGDLNSLQEAYSRPARTSDIPWSLRDRWPASTETRIVTSNQWGHELIGAGCEFQGSPGDGEGKRECTLWRTCFGWPFLSLERLELLTFGGNEECKKFQAYFLERFPSSGAIQVPSSLALSGSTFLPAHPIWPGFALSTIFYAAICAAILIIPGRLRARSRAAAGLCPTCAYPTSPNTPTCPECGTQLSSPPPFPDASMP